MKTKKISYDRCNICLNIVRSDFVIDNRCPTCGSEDMDDYDPNSPEEDEDDEWMY